MVTVGTYMSVKITDWTGRASVEDLQAQARKRYEGLKYQPYVEPVRRKVVRDRREQHDYDDWV